MSENKVKWHPYPEDEPEYYKSVLVTLIHKDGSELVSIDQLHYRPNSKRKKEWGFDNTELKVVAWAEKPDPYRPPKQIDNHPDAETARKYMQNDPETLKKLGIFD